MCITTSNYRICVFDLHSVFSRPGGIWSTDAEVEEEVDVGTVVETVNDTFTTEVLEEI